jgi:hypothetical protein
MALSMHLESMNEYLLKSFEMQLFYPAELPEFFFILAQSFEMLTINRSHLVSRMVSKELLPLLDSDSQGQSLDLQREKQLEARA